VPTATPPSRPATYRAPRGTTPRPSRWPRACPTSRWRSWCPHGGRNSWPTDAKSALHSRRSQRRSRTRRRPRTRTRTRTLAVTPLTVALALALITTLTTTLTRRRAARRPAGPRRTTGWALCTCTEGITSRRTVLSSRPGTWTCPTKSWSRRARTRMSCCLAATGTGRGKPRSSHKKLVPRGPRRRARPASPARLFTRRPPSRLRRRHARHREGRGRDLRPRALGAAAVRRHPRRRGRRRRHAARRPRRRRHAARRRRRRAAHRRRRAAGPTVCSGAHASALVRRCRRRRAGAVR
jgi:hypothetical protein